MSRLDPARNGEDFNELLAEYTNISHDERVRYYGSYCKRQAIQDDELLYRLPNRTKETLDQVTEKELDGIFGPCRPQEDDDDFLY